MPDPSRFDLRSNDLCEQLLGLETIRCYRHGVSDPVKRQPRSTVPSSHFRKIKPASRALAQARHHLYIRSVCLTICPMLDKPSPRHKFDGKSFLSPEASHAIRRTSRLHLRQACLAVGRHATRDENAPTVRDRIRDEGN